MLKMRPDSTHFRTGKPALPHLWEADGAAGVDEREQMKIHPKPFLISFVIGWVVLLLWRWVLN